MEELHITFNAERFIDKYTCRLCLKQRQEISAQLHGRALLPRDFTRSP
jgi:hypothetical protein